MSAVATEILQFLAILTVIAVLTTGTAIALIKIINAAPAATDDQKERYKLRWPDHEIRLTHTEAGRHLTCLVKIGDKFVPEDRVFFSD